MNKNKIINSIFFPRKSHLPKDDLDHLVEVEKNIFVGVRFFLKDSSFDNVLFFHGNAELSQEYDEIADYYHKIQCNFIVSDYRGYGLSNGIPEKDNLLEDSSKIFDYVKNYLKDREFKENFLIMGRSLGSASAWEIVSRRPDSIDACIIESGFATENFLLDLFNIPSSEMSINLGDGFDSLKKISKYSKPLLIIHAENDHIVPLSQARLAFKSALSENKKILVVESANHNNIIYCLRDKYFKDIRVFIDSI